MEAVNQTVLVTGGAGFVGSHTVVELVKNRYDVVILDNLHNSNAGCICRIEEICGRKIPFYRIDLADTQALDKLFREHRFDSVLHFAGVKAVGDSVQRPLFYYQTNVTGTLNLLKTMKTHKVYKFVFSSSTTVYGPPQYLPVDENHPRGECTNPYGKTKYFIEEILRDTCKAEPEWTVILLRYFNPVGAHCSGMIGEDPRGVPHNLMPFLSQVAIGKRQEIQIYGDDYTTPDGTAVRDYIHVMDLAIGHVASLKKLPEDGGCKAYNLGTGVGYSVLEVLKMFEKVSGKSIAYKVVNRRDGDVPVCYGDASKAERELDWKATRNLQQICEDMWRWQSANPDGFENVVNGV